MAVGTIFDIQRFAVHDGPGIRTNIFMKGCPLRCWWCQNPEGQSPHPELMYFEFKCLHCHLCADICPLKAIKIVNKEGGGDIHIIDRDKCDACGVCSNSCPSGALKMVGEVYTVEQLMEKIKRDVPLYDASGGGVTFTGGEPLFQPQFLKEVLIACKDLGIHRAVETSGFVSRDVMRSLMRDIDLFLHDIKLMDDRESTLYVGAPSKPMLSNLKFLVESGRGKDVIIRFPVIPTITDTDRNVRRIADFLSALHDIEEIHLLPFHDVGEKYQRLGMQYKMTVHEPPSSERLEEIKEIFEDIGLRVIFHG